MNAQRITGRFGLRLPRSAALGGPLFGAAALAALLLGPIGPAWAQRTGNPCPSDLLATGQCQEQVQAPVSYSGDQSQGWAYYCTGDFPIAYSLPNQGAYAYTWDSACFTVTENPSQETDDTSKFDLVSTNWCPFTEVLNVAIACLTSN